MFSRLDHVGVQPSSKKQRLVQRMDLPLLNKVLWLYKFPAMLIRGNEGRICREYLSNFLTDPLINRLHLQPRCQTLLHAVNDLQFNRTLPLSLGEPLRFTEQTRFFER